MNNWIVSAWLISEYFLYHISKLASIVDVLIKYRPYARRFFCSDGSLCFVFLHSREWKQTSVYLLQKSVLAILEKKKQKNKTETETSLYDLCEM